MTPSRLAAWRRPRRTPGARFEADSTGGREAARSGCARNHGGCGERNREAQGQETTVVSSQAGTGNLRAQHCTRPRGVTGAGKVHSLYPPVVPLPSNARPGVGLSHGAQFRAARRRTWWGQAGDGDGRGWPGVVAAEEEAGLGGGREKGPARGQGTGAPGRPQRAAPHRLHPCPLAGGAGRLLS